MLHYSPSRTIRDPLIKLIIIKNNEYSSRNYDHSLYMTYTINSVLDYYTRDFSPQHKSYRRDMRLRFNTASGNESIYFLDNFNKILARASCKVGGRATLRIISR